MKDRKEVVTRADVKKVFGKDNVFTDMLTRVVMRVLGINKINRLYSKSAHLKGLDFADDMLRVYNTTWNRSLDQLSVIPKEGPFVIVGNHPFGAIEGVLLYSAIGRIRPDFKLMANFLLTYLEPVKDAFIAVNPFQDNPEWGNSVGGIRAALEHLKEGHGLAIFPAGEVSRYHGHDYPEDIEWSASIARLIQKTKVPVIPLYIDGKNSKRFYFLSKINSMLSTACLPHEMTNKRNMDILFRLGKPITASELEPYSDPKELAAYLRSRAYALEANIPFEKPMFRHCSAVEMDKQKDVSAMIKELESVRDTSLIFSCLNYDCYLLEHDSIPTLMHEIGRRREEAFRAIGEGSGKAIDIDQYDAYYKHLVLWDREKKSLIGAYRLGYGSEIVPKYGLDGFYISSLFKMNDSLKERASKSVELGRSFVSVEYQKDMMPLLLLLRGLMMVVVRNKDIQSFIGPVSISTWYPKFYQSLIVRYVSTMHNSDTLKNEFSPRTPFKEDFLKVDADVLLSKNMDSLEKFDRFMLKLSNGAYRMPTLFKRYLKLGAKFLCFNIDPDFNDTLDGLLFINFNEVPKSELEMLMKDSPDEERKVLLQRFGYDE